jgi:predicted membrane protein
MENNKPSIISPQFILGLIIIAVGVVFMLDNMDIIYAGDFLRYWPVLLIAYGVTKVSQSSKNSGQIFGWILILIGALKLLDVMNFINFRIWDWWPIVFIVIGLNFLRGSWNRSRTVNIGAADNSFDDTDAYIKNIAMMSGVKRKITSKEFRGGELTAIMGGCEIDLRDADMKGEEAVLDVVAVWGGIEIRVPMGWSVSVKATPIMGGVEDGTYPSKEGTPKRLVITGNIVMGGVEIKN